MVPAGIELLFLLSLFFFLTLFLPYCQSSSLSSSQSIVYDHVKSNANLTFREASGFLKYPYLVPAGPYNQLWDWDSVFMGVGLLDFGSAEYLAGSMKNFFDHTNTTDGEVKGCLTPSGASQTIYHAKPVLIQGAWLVSKHQNDTSQFSGFKDQMKAQLDYWDSQRLDTKTGLYVWHDQMESGADNLVISECPSDLSPCWKSTDADTIASSDLQVFMAREHTAYSLFLKAWAADAHDESEAAEMLRQAEEHNNIADGITKSGLSKLWNDSKGCFLAYNRTTKAFVDNRVFLMAFPLFGKLATSYQAERAVEAILKPDMLTQFGFRSTSSADPRYTNENVIVPYSNWRGPIWIISNVLLSYGLARYKHDNLALGNCDKILDLLAADLNKTNTWHECYNSETGDGLAAPGFLSWNVLAATLKDNLTNKKDPFEL